MSFTYTTLKSALTSFTEDTGTEFSSALDTIIPLAEEKLLRDLGSEIFDVTATGNFSSGNPVLNKPSGMVALRTLHYTDGSSNFVLMEPKSWEFVKDYWPNSSTTTATPKYFADYDNAGTQAWYLAGTPSSGLAYTARYIKRPSGLSGSVSTTWLSTNAGDVLFYACLIVGEQYLKADERIGTWKQEYMERLGAARAEMKLEDRADYMPMTAIPAKEA